MNVSNLNVGQVFGSKAQLYREIGIEPASGMKNREYQNREVQRYLSWRQLYNNKRSIIITEIFSEPKPKIDNRGKHGNQTGNSLYAKEMDLLILSMMQKEKSIDATYNYIFTHQIPLFTARYEKSKLNNTYGISADFFIEFNTVETYLSTITNKVQGSFLRSLNRLQKKGIITYEPLYKVIYTQDSESTTATEHEIRTIKNIQNQAYEKFGVAPNRFIPHHLRIVCRTGTLKMLREHTDLYNFWKSYRIELVNTKVKTVSKTEIETALKEITRLFVISTHQTMSMKQATLEEGDNNKCYTPFSSSIQITKIIKLDSLIWSHSQDGLDNQNLYYKWEHDFKFYRSLLSGKHDRLLREKINKISSRK